MPNRVLFSIFFSLIGISHMPKAFVYSNVFSFLRIKYVEQARIMICDREYLLIMVSWLIDLKFTRKCWYWDVRIWSTPLLKILRECCVLWLVTLVFLHNSYTFAISQYGTLQERATFVLIKIITKISKVLVNEVSQIVFCWIRKFEKLSSVLDTTTLVYQGRVKSADTITRVETWACENF